MLLMIGCNFVGLDNWIKFLLLIYWIGFEFVIMVLKIFLVILFEMVLFEIILIILVKLVGVKLVVNKLILCLFKYVLMFFCK